MSRLKVSKLNLAMHNSGAHVPLVERRLDQPLNMSVVCIRTTIQSSKSRFVKLCHADWRKKREMHDPGA